MLAENYTLDDRKERILRENQNFANQAFNSERDARIRASGGNVPGTYSRTFTDPKAEAAATQRVAEGVNAPQMERFPGSLENLRSATPGMARVHLGADAERFLSTFPNTGKQINPAALPEPPARHVHPNAVYKSDTPILPTGPANYLDSLKDHAAAMGAGYLEDYKQHRLAGPIYNLSRMYKDAAKGWDVIDGDVVTPAIKWAVGADQRPQSSTVAPASPAPKPGLSHSDLRAAQKEARSQSSLAGSPSQSAPKPLPNPTGVDGSALPALRQEGGQYRQDLGANPDGSMNFISSGDKAAMERVNRELMERGGVKHGKPTYSPEELKEGKSDFWRNHGYAGGMNEYKAERDAKEAEAQQMRYLNSLQQAALNPYASPEERQAATQMFHAATGMFGQRAASAAHAQDSQARLAEQRAYHKDQLALGNAQLESMDRYRKDQIRDKQAEAEAKASENAQKQKERYREQNMKYAELISKDKPWLIPALYSAYGMRADQLKANGYEVDPMENDPGKLSLLLNHVQSGSDEERSYGNDWIPLNDKSYNRDYLSTFPGILPPKS